MLLVDVWVDEEEVLSGNLDRPWRVTIWRLVGGEVDADGPHRDPRPGTYTRQEAECVAREVVRSLRVRKFAVIVAGARGRFAAETLRDVLRRWGIGSEGERDREADRPTHAVDPGLLLLEELRLV